MPIADTFGNRCDRLLRIHLRRVNDVHYDVANAVKFAQSAYGRCGVLVEVASSRSVHLPVETARDVASFRTASTTDAIADNQAELVEWFAVPTRRPWPMKSRTCFCGRAR